LTTVRRKGGKELWKRIRLASGKLKKKEERILSTVRRKGGEETWEQGKAG
jgi:hypothetical protein